MGSQKKKKGNYFKNNKASKANISVDQIMNNLKVVQADFEKSKEFIKEVCGIDDIQNKVIVLRINYSNIHANEFTELHKSLFAINETLKKNNSTFIILPDAEYIKDISIEDIDKAIEELNTLKSQKEEGKDEVFDYAGV